MPYGKKTNCLGVIRMWQPGLSEKDAVSTPLNKMAPAQQWGIYCRYVLAKMAYIQYWLDLWDVKDIQ